MSESALSFSYLTTDSFLSIPSNSSFSSFLSVCLCVFAPWDVLPSWWHSGGLDKPRAKKRSSSPIKVVYGLSGTYQVPISQPV